MYKLLCTLLFVLPYLLPAQQVVWTQKPSASVSDDRLFSITSLDTNGYYAVGGGYLHRVRISTFLTDGSHIAKFGKSGNLLWVRPLGYAGYAKSVVKVDERTLAVVTEVSDFNVQADRGGFVFQLVDSTGSIITSRVIQNPFFPYKPYGMFKAKNGDLMVYGISVPGQVFPNTNTDWFLARITPQGFLDWLKVYNPGSTDPTRFAAFNDAGGNIILGGSSLNRTVSMIVDSNGVVVENTRVLFVPPTAGTQSLTLVQRCPDGGLLTQTSVLAGTSVPPDFHIAKLRPDFSQEWVISEIGHGSGVPCRVNADGSVVYVSMEGRTRNFYMTKVHSTGQQLWRILITPLSSSSTISLTGITYNSDQSAVLCGYISDNTRVPYQGEDFYLTKIANFGRPFDPLTELGGPREMAQSVGPVAFPNPTSGQVQFRGLDRPGQLRLFTTAGSLALDAPILPDQSLDLAGLAPGLYLYRLTVADGKAPFVGRVVVR